MKAVLGPDAPVNSWDLILSQKIGKTQKLRRSLSSTRPKKCLPPCLIIWVKIPNSTKADDYTGPATDLLLKLRPNIRYFHSSQYINDLANGDTCVAIGWAGDYGRR